jgi:uncharacterized protein YqgV (UPF0045/DUF77 family)
MLAELSIIPVGNGGQPNQELAEILKVVDSFGLPYQLTLATCIEGEWSEIMELVRQCHQRARAVAPHVVTLLKIEDERRGDTQVGE